MCPIPCLLTSGLIGGSDYLLQTFQTVVEHIHGLAVAPGRRHHAKKALEILVTLARKATLPLVDATWIRELLYRPTRQNMGDDMFTLFLRLNARTNEEGVMVDLEIPPGQDHTLFVKILQNVQACSARACGCVEACSAQACSWGDEAVYGGLIAIRDIPRLGNFLPDNDSLRMLLEATEKGKPFRVRKAAYDIIAITLERWLRSPELHQTFGDLVFPRKLHDIVTEIGRPDYQKSFLMMMEILSDDKKWHPYLREAMVIWLPFRREGPHEVLRIITRIGELPQPEHDGFNHNLDEFLETLVENEWARVPARPVEDLTFKRLNPFAEVTLQLMEIVFTEGGRRAVLAAVKKVIMSLEKRLDLGEVIHDIVKPLQDILQGGTSPTEDIGQSSHVQVVQT